jgi:uncharacterized protein YndB with AHSA1/START domain
MARNALVVAAPPERVWEVLADPVLYGDWVVGSDVIRDWDDDWPAVGTRIHHRIGRRPVAIADHTEVLESVAPRRLVLRAHARPFPPARVVLEVEPHPAGTLVTMIEDPDMALVRRVVPVHPVVRLRNGESLRRLRALAERSHGR